MISDAEVDMDFMEAMTVLRSQYDFDILCLAIGYIPENLMDKIFIHEMDTQLILVPAPQMLPQYLYILRIVSMAIWIATFSLLIMIAILIAFAKKNSREKFGWLTLFEDNMRLLVNASLPERIRGGQEKILLLLWMFYCLIFDTMFNSYLTSALVRPKYYPAINTFEDLYKTDLKVNKYVELNNKVMTMVRNVSYF